MSVYRHEGRFYLADERILLLLLLLFWLFFLFLSHVYVYLPIQTIDHDDCGQEKEQLIDQGRSINGTWQRQPISPPANLFHVLSETDMLISPSASNRKQMANDPDESDSSNRPKRATSLISPTGSTTS